MRILGVDPGTRHLGWGIVEAQGTRLVHNAHGIVHTDTAQPLERRLVQIDEALREVLLQYGPEEAAVESLFYAKDAQAASKLGHARGVVLLVLAKGGVPIREYPPARVKRTVCGRGRATKQQVAMMVRALLGMRELPGTDATDALAVALTHAQFARVDRVMHAASPAREPGSIRGRRR